MSDWTPATEAEAAMRDALRAGDQELYFRVLARIELLLPVSADALAGRTPMGWGTWTTNGRTHVLAFTSGESLQACLAEHAGSARRMPYHELAASWPNLEWWLAVNPGLPIEGYLPAWFVSQLSRGDVRLPGRSLGARARLDRPEPSSRARATASVPRRTVPARARAEASTAAAGQSTAASSAGPSAAASSAGPSAAAPSAAGPMSPGPVSPGPVSPGPVSPGPVSPGPSAVGPTSPGPGDVGPTSPGPLLPPAPILPPVTGGRSGPSSAAAPGAMAAELVSPDPASAWSERPTARETAALPDPDAVDRESGASDLMSRWSASALAAPGLGGLAGASTNGAEPAAALPTRVRPPVEARPPLEEEDHAAEQGHPAEEFRLPVREAHPRRAEDHPGDNGPQFADPLVADPYGADRPARANGASPAEVDPSEFEPANPVEESLLDAAGGGSTDSFLSTLLLAKVLVPLPAGAAREVRPGDDGFVWHTEVIDDERYVVVFTSRPRLTDHMAALPSADRMADAVPVKFVRLIRAWPDESWSFAVNPGTPVGATLPGTEIVALASWAAEVGLGDDVDEPAPEEPVEPAPAPQASARAPDPRPPTMMQKAIAPAQVGYYLDRGYDRVSGFVHRVDEVAHLHTPAKLHAALGLGYPNSPFIPDASEVFALRWPAYRPSLYRIPYGGQSEAAMRAMEGWVIERPPFRGNGFAPGDNSDVIAEFKVDSVRLPHGTQLWRMTPNGEPELVALLDADGPIWRRAGDR